MYDKTTVLSLEELVSLFVMYVFEGETRTELDKEYIANLIPKFVNDIRQELSNVKVQINNIAERRDEYGRDSRDECEDR